MKKDSNSIPKFTEEQYEYLARVFPRLDIQPSSTLSEIQFNAGAQQVLQHVASKVESWNRVRVGPD